MCALLERAGGMRADNPAIKEKLPAQEVSLPAQCALSHVFKVKVVLAIKSHMHHDACIDCLLPSLLCVMTAHDIG